jgi:ADP-dependent NAD(P)H-hydrate dehydratase
MPHYGEMAQLCACERQEVARDPAGIASRVARERNVVVALKGATTHIANPTGDLWVYRGGSIGLGTSGSGDVLAGVIAGLVAQGAAADQAAVWGVVLHGEAGRVLSARIGKLGFLAREIADEIPKLRAAVGD